MQEPVLLMIHGLIGPLDFFGPAARIANAEVHAVDLLGYGTLGGARRDRLTLRAQAEHVASRIVSLSDGPAWLLGHSMGGAVAVLVADRRPELVRGIINVEGNFTLRDTFWSGEIVKRSLEDWSAEYREMRRDVPALLTRWGYEQTEQRIEWMMCILDNQPASTLHWMSKAIVEETGEPAYLDALRRVVERGVPIHLIAGERSAGDWDVPGFVREAARSYTEIARTGHVMMLEDPDAFCRTVDSILASG